MWVKLDDEFPDHPKFATLSPFYRLLTQHLHINAICWCNRHLTDGVVPRGMVNRLGSDIEALSELLAREPVMLHQVINELLAVGLWEEDKTGDYHIHDYLEYQPSRAAVLKERHDTLVRVQRFRAGRNGMRNGMRNGAVTPAPDPDPDPKDQNLSRAREQPGSPGMSGQRKQKHQPNVKGAWSCPHQPGCRSTTKCIARALAEGRAAKKR